MSTQETRPTFDSIREDFAFLEDWEDRYRYLIELGRQLGAVAGERTHRREQGARLRQPGLAMDAPQ